MIKKIDSDTISITDGEIKNYGADQAWYKKKIHEVSGCGPTTAALITMYMATVFPQGCANLYDYEMPAKKDDFISHMTDVREFVKPGPFGLTDPKYFAAATRAYAKSKGVKIISQKISRSLSVGVAFGFVKKAIDEKYMPALLILKNPAEELSDFTWHWMAITGYDDEKQTIYISTYAKEFELDFRKVWNQNKPYKTELVYFYNG